MKFNGSNKFLKMLACLRQRGVTAAKSMPPDRLQKKDLSPQFSFEISDFSIPVWSSFNLDGLSRFHRVQQLMKVFGIKKFLAIYNPFTQYRLKEWIKRNSQFYSLGSLSRIQSKPVSHTVLEGTFSAENAVAPLLDGAYYLVMHENYLELSNTDDFIIFDDHNNWTKESIRNFILLFSKKLKEYTHHKLPNPEAFNSLILPGDVLNDLKKDLGAFLESQELYRKDLELPWRRGIMLYGPPGNGKTMCVRKTCEYFGLDHIDIDQLIRQDGSLELERAVHERETIDGDLYPEDERPVACILEDIDKYTSFQSGEAEKDSGKISLHALLKGLDGVDEVSGVILFATTNFPDMLHEAIAGRPGRFDKVYEIKKPSLDSITRLLKYHKISIVDGSLDFVAGELNGSSMAFAAEFIKSAKMQHKRNAITQEEAKVLLDAIHRHQSLCRKHFKETKSLGFSK